ncbi:hypothetical protein [Bacillus thuringiensis]|uniref:hypothetical protein n=1 Tax=Bacillus thuringiensis TaxID=1428 RepID=UPI00110437A8|nr:hypothetical protein [Bacillus thuringiensis]TEA81207.1 hypothetical protein PBMB05447_22825 [Bacillus thuringiensis F14-1]
MAKLANVKVVNENTVEYNGFVYELVTGDAKAADVIKASEQELDVTEGAFYLVVDIDDDNDIVFKDNVDDSNYFSQGEHSVFRKSHVITTDKLTDAEGVVTITLPDGTKLEGTPSDLEKITRSMQKMQAEQGSSEEEAVEVENASEPVSERLQVGDYAKVITHDDNGQSKFGDIVKVTEDDESNVPFDTKHLDGSYAGWHYENDLVRATEAEVKAATATKDEPLTIGDYAKIIQEGHGNFGKVVKITNDNRDGQLYPYSTELLDGTFGDIHSENHLVKATEAEALEAKQALLKEGDFARVISNEATTEKAGAHKFEIRTVVKLGRGNWDKDVFKAYYLNESDWWNVHRKDLEPLTAEEAEYIAREAEEEKKAKAERAKWAAIGREVGEIKKGDIVRTTSHCGSVNPVGTIGIARGDSTVDSCSTVALAGDSGNWSSVVLIVPVEQRFDTVG